MHETIILSQLSKVFDSLYSEDTKNSIELTQIRDAFRSSQIKSKIWLLENLCPYLNHNHKIAILGSWFGFIAACLSNLGFNHITDIDIDSKVQRLSERLNSSNTYYKRINRDANEIDLTGYEVVINTSAEHMSTKWLENVSNNTLIAIQSNNIDIPEHINLCHNLEQMKEKYQLKILYSGQLEFKTYNRFQLIGIKI